MTAPRLICEIAFASDPITANASASWEDVTTRLRGRVWIQRGRGHELSDIEAGRMTLTLDNHDRRFDPSNENAGEPYYDTVLLRTRVRPMKKIRLGVIWDDGGGDETHWRFTGYVESWRIRFGNGTLAFADLRCVDAWTYFSKIPIRADNRAQEVSGDRISAILDAVFWPAGDRAISVGDVDVQEMPLEDTALNHMQLVARTEAGQLYMSRSGNVTFEDQSFRNLTSSVATFSNDAAGSFARYADLTIAYDDTAIFNRIEISRDGGVTTRTVQSDDSIVDYFLRTRVEHGLLYVDGTAADATGVTLVTRYKDSWPRPDRLTVDPAIGEMWADILPLDISSRITLIRASLADSDAMSFDAFIEGVEDSIGMEGSAAGVRLYHIAYTLSPVVETTGVLTLDSLSVWTDATPLLAGSWALMGSPYAPPGYWRDDERRVYLRGALTNPGAALPSVIFTLPVGYRPPYRQVFTIATSTGTTGLLVVQQNGDVTLNTGDPAFIDLASVRFRNH